jgi:hypothetical protein
VGHVAHTGEMENAHNISIRFLKFLDQVSNFQLLKVASAPLQ